MQVLTLWRLPTKTLFLLLRHNCNLASFMNCNVNIWYSGYLTCNHCERVVQCTHPTPKKVENHCSRSNCSAFIGSTFAVAPQNKITESVSVQPHVHSKALPRVVSRDQDQTFHKQQATWHVVQNQLDARLMGIDPQSFYPARGRSHHSSCLPKAMLQDCQEQSVICTESRTVFRVCWVCVTSSVWIQSGRKQLKEGKGCLGSCIEDTAQHHRAGTPPSWQQEQEVACLHLGWSRSKEEVECWGYSASFWSVFFSSLGSQPMG